MSEVITTPPIAKTGIAGRSSAANIPARREPVVSSARRKIPQAVRPPSKTAGSRAANISEPVSRRLKPPNTSVPSRITQAISGPREK